MATFKKFQIWDLSEDKVARKDDDERVINTEHIIEVKGVGTKTSTQEVYWVTLVNRDWFTTTTEPYVGAKKDIFGKKH